MKDKVSVWPPENVNLLTFVAAIIRYKWIFLMLGLVLPTLLSLYAMVVSPEIQAIRISLPVQLGFGESTDVSEQRTSWIFRDLQKASALERPTMPLVPECSLLCQKYFVESFIREAGKSEAVLEFGKKLAAMSGVHFKSLPLQRQPDPSVRLFSNPEPGRADEQGYQTLGIRFQFVGQGPEQQKELSALEQRGQNLLRDLLHAHYQRYFMAQLTHMLRRADQDLSVRRESYQYQLRVMEHALNEYRAGRRSGEVPLAAHFDLTPLMTARSELKVIEERQRELRSALSLAGNEGLEPTGGAPGQKVYERWMAEIEQRWQDSFGSLSPVVSNAASSTSLSSLAALYFVSGIAVATLVALALFISPAVILQKPIKEISEQLRAARKTSFEEPT